MITLYVPSDSNLNDVITQVKKEMTTSGNIKNKTTKNDTYNALKNGLHKIKSIKQMPENGFVLCSGNTKQRL